MITAMNVPDNIEFHIHFHPFLLVYGIIIPLFGVKMQRRVGKEGVGMNEKEEYNEEINLDEDKLKDMLVNQDIIAFREEYLLLHPYDRAIFYEKVDPELRKMIYHYLSPKELAEIFETSEIDEDEYRQFLQEMDTTYAADMISYMFVDNAVDVLKELDKAQVVSYLTLMDKNAADEIKALLHYEEHTAGSIMTTEYVTVPQNSTVRSGMTILRNEAPGAETIYYVFVVDDDNRLTGVVSLRDLIIADEDTLISSIMSERVVSVLVSEDQEEVARMIKDYNFLAVPVVDFQQHILGIITVDDIIDVLDEEASDDYSKLAAVSNMDTFDKNSFSAAKKRLPWLLILLVLGMLTANLIDLFTETISKVALLAAFIPLLPEPREIAVRKRSLLRSAVLQQGTWKTKANLNYFYGKREQV